MASSLFLLLDDIATILDDVSTMTKVAARRPPASLGDDLALNANKSAACIPIASCPSCGRDEGLGAKQARPGAAALAISAILPWAVTPLS